MSFGVYIHVPFCKKACHYCDFHFSTAKERSSVLSAMVLELEQRARRQVDTQALSLYLGGGTPSLLAEDELALLFNAFHKSFNLAPHAEVTLEANPDDLTTERLQMWRRLGVNRLSVGIQSFNAVALKWMNRAHDASQAERAIPLIKDAGFSNYSIDLIYGVPVNTDGDWAVDLEKALQHQPPHLSAYALTVEQGTALAHFVNKGTVAPATEQRYEHQYEQLVVATKQVGMEQYEVSNFALPNRYAVHNTSYWQGIPYIGIGPSAHSFDGYVRRWNVANNGKYQKALRTSDLNYYEEEILTEANQYNEYVMTGLRTQWGIQEGAVVSRFSPGIVQHFQKSVEKLVQQKLLITDEGRLRIPEAHRFLSDGIAAALFKI
ncbi:MAG: radical SAM family heme chaperone HemW [Schleiferiaceae bacterium]|nr:radical SAM family heme chaperone HemW [Schleiferiaceae bacterium]